MIKPTLANHLSVMILLLCGNLSPMKASGDTPITVKDGGSILLLAGGVDASSNWKVSPAEVRHLKPSGVLTGVRITDGGADQCAGNPTCGIDTGKPWQVRVIYTGRWMTIGSVSANKGLDLKFSPKITFDQWKKTGNADERVFGHGDGRHISSIKVNGSATSLCSGKGSCEVTLTYTTP